MKKTFLVVLILVLIGLLVFTWKKDQEESMLNSEKTEQNQSLSQKEEATPKEVVNQTEERKVESEEPQEIKIPSSLKLEVPFISQAPFSKWDHLHDEACEEASILMVHYYLNGVKSVTPEKGEEGLQDLVQIENRMFGYFESTTVEQTAQLVREKWGYKTQISKDVSIDSIKKELAKGNPVILPAAGRELKNPNFRSPGPLYHMLVVTGYDSKNFITNDPGTRKGKDYEYPYSRLIDAVHDWNGGDVNNGLKAMLIVTK